MSGRQFGDRFVELFLVLDIGHTTRHPTDGTGGAVAAIVGSDSQCLAVAGMEVDLDRPPELRYSEVESDIAVTGEFDSMLANQTANPGSTQGFGHADLGM